MAETDRPIPKRLRKEPLLEAVWELRFSSDKNSVAELLPGMIYQAVGSAFDKIERLPAANLPPLIMQQDAKLKYIPTIRLDGNPYSILIGEHVVSLSCRRPYTGWENFKSKIMELVNKLKETHIITHPERFSLKYIDVISTGNVPSLTPLEVVLRMGGYELINSPVQLRTEIREDGFLHIVQIASPAQVVLATGESYEGSLIDIDTICQREPDIFGSDFDGMLDQAHHFSKLLFFRILTDTTIDLLEPEY